MFWGLQLEAGLRYSQQVPESFRITKATLDATAVVNGGSGGGGAKKDGIVQLFLEQDGTEFAIATLKHGSVYDAPLDLRFEDGEDICFFLKGEGLVSLSGHLILHGQEDDDDDDMMPQLCHMQGSSDEESEDFDEEEDDSEDDDSDEEPQLVEVKDDSEVIKMNGGKPVRKAIGIPQPKEQQQEAEEEEDDSEDDDDFDEDDDLDEEDDDSDDLDEESEEEEIVVKPGQKRPSTVMNGGSGKTPDGKKAKKLNAATSAETPTNKSAAKKEQQQQPSNKTPSKTKDNKENRHQDAALSKTPQAAAAKTPSRSEDVKKLIVEDIRPGTGPVAKRGKKVHVYYAGTLLNGKKFDACLSGKPFDFKLGAGDVISGWDQGIDGMRVGGKRRLIIPAQLAYGKRGSGPIPPNAALKFEVELKAVN